MSPVGALPQSRRQPSPGAVLGVASFGAFLAFLDSTIVNVAFPDIARSFPDATIGELSWVFNAYNIVFAAFLVAAGRVADLLGRKRVFLYGIVLFTVTSAGCALAGTLGQLVALRALQGLGAAMLVPASLALVVEGFTAQRRAHGIGLWGASAAVASGLGPPIGGGLVALSDWRLVFLINVPLGVLAVVVARRGLVESRAPGRRRVPDLRGAALLGACLGLLTLGVVQGEEWGWTSARVVVALVASAAALVAFVASSRSHPAGANRVFGDMHIEQLPREFRAVSVDLLARSRYVHERGRVADAVAASVRLPGLYPPYLLDGRLHVDGGVLDNLPVTTLAEPREGPVVAVSISFGGSGDGRSAGRPRIPALGDTLMRTMMMSSASAADQARAQADVVISPEAAGVGLLEFHQIDRMREQGRMAARDALPSIEAALSGAPAAAPQRSAQPA